MGGDPTPRRRGSLAAFSGGERSPRARPGYQPPGARVIPVEVVTAPLRLHIRWGRCQWAKLQLALAYCSLLRLSPSPGHSAWSRSYLSCPCGSSGPANAAGSRATPTVRLHLRVAREYHPSPGWPGHAVTVPTPSAGHTARTSVPEKAHSSCPGRAAAGPGSTVE